jgi:hypothetical protein
MKKLHHSSVIEEKYFNIKSNPDGIKDFSYESYKNFISLKSCLKDLDVNMTDKEFIQFDVET